MFRKPIPCSLTVWQPELCYVVCVFLPWTLHTGLLCIPSKNFVCNWFLLCTADPVDYLSEMVVISADGKRRHMVRGTSQLESWHRFLLAVFVGITRMTEGTFYARAIDATIRWNTREEIKEGVYEVAVRHSACWQMSLLYMVCIMICLLDMALGYACESRP